MRSALFVLVAAVAVSGLILTGCAQAAPAPTPSQAVAVPTKAVEPTAPPKAMAPTSAPIVQSTPVSTAAKVNYPGTGKSINFIVPWPAGGPVDTMARMLAPALEKELGTQLPISNKGGASTQVGLTELAKSSKPDGYTILAANMPTTVTTYMDPETKAVYGRNDFQPVALYLSDPFVLVVAADSPYKSLKDVVDAAKAKPGEVKVGTVGLTSATHFAILVLQELTNTTFARVHFDGGAPATTALLGGHVDAAVLSVPNVSSNVKSGKARVLAVFDSEESKFLPGIKTAEALGYKVYSTTSTGLIVPKGTPTEIVRILSAAVKKSIESSDVIQRMDGLGYSRRYMDTDRFTTFWTEQEDENRRLLPMVRR
jgi:tripartite-type tricarboxylate transporter receptor subunit TctC